jgi:hypothetical protein
MGLTSDLKEWRDGILGDVQRMTSNVAAGIRLGRVVDVVFVLGAPGTPLTVGTHVFLRVGLNGPATILSWAMGATVAGAAASGAITVDLLTGDMWWRAAGIREHGRANRSAADSCLDGHAARSKLADGQRDRG